MFPCTCNHLVGMGKVSTVHFFTVHFLPLWFEKWKNQVHYLIKNVVVVITSNVMYTVQETFQIFVLVA